MSKERAKGTRFESEVVEYLKANGFPYAERRAMQGKNDKGDIAGVPGVVIECKNHNKILLSEWMKETETERVNADAQLGVLIVRRTRKPIEDAYCVIPLSQFCELLQ